MPTGDDDDDELTRWLLLAACNADKPRERERRASLSLCLRETKEFARRARAEEVIFTFGSSSFSGKVFFLN